jgi:large subunit ribosomal protein L1
VAELVERNRLYVPREAVELVRKLSISKFDGGVDVHLRLGVDPRKTDQQVRGTVILPHGTGKPVRVLVFAEGEAEKIARDAGADYVGSTELAEKIEKESWTDFDVAIAIPSMMRVVGKLGRVLGRKGLMPNPKSGTVVNQEDLPRVIAEVRRGKVEFRTDKQALIHVSIGRISFTDDQLYDNFIGLIDAIRRAKPAAVKGAYVRTIVLSPTMGPSVRVDVSAAMATKAAA